ncbi:MAG: protein BatD, partial [Gammaproteobacteria bacterium]
ELSADKAEVYVQEQLTLTVRLFFNGNLIRGDLSEPEHPNAIIEPLGKQQEFSRYRDGVRYRVVERRYALFPQKPGTLTLSPIKFEGQARDADGKLVFLRDSEQLYDVPVKDIPASFTGDTWLPASQLSLTESGLPPTMNVETGENLTRELVLEAEGLPSEALPPLPDEVPDGIRSYPEQPERTTIKTPEGLTSTLAQTTALVPIEPGAMELPEIRIPWWDTKTDSQKFAIVEAKTLRVGGSVPAKAEDPPAAASPVRDQSATAEAQPVATDSADGSDRSPWQWLAILFCTLWLITLAAWWMARKRAANTQRKVGHEQEDGRESVAFEALIDAARKGSPTAPVLLVRWMNLRFTGHHFQSATDAVRFAQNPELKAEFEKLQSHLFSGQNMPSNWDGKGLARALQELRNRHQRGAGKAGAKLPPLYPQNLTA